MPTALVVHHDANSDTGLVGRHLLAGGWQLVDHTVCPRNGDPTSDQPFPELSPPTGAPGFDLLLLLGSRWSVYDRASIARSVGGWIDAELDLVRRADDLGIRTWGICFGAQVIAAAFGGAVEPSTEPEIGWCRVDSDHPVIGAGPWFQWHGDRVITPPDAKILATSPGNVQAFTVGNAVAVQFHPEVDRHVLDVWLETDRDELVDAGVDVDELLSDTDRRTAEVERRTARLVDWAIGPAPL